MKTLIFVFAIAFIAISCGDIYYVDPVQADPRDIFIGKYSVNEYSSTYDEYRNYDVSIYKGSNGQIVINNFYNSGLSVYTNVIGNRFHLNWQSINGYEMQGDGYVEGDQLTLNYKIRDTYSDNAAWDFCTATGWFYY